MVKATPWIMKVIVRKRATKLLMSIVTASFGKLKVNVAVAALAISSL